MKKSVEEIPFLKPKQDVSKSCIKNSKEIHFLKQANPQADTSVLEKEIDVMVYELYGLTEEEIQIVEGS